MDKMKPILAVVLLANVGMASAGTYINYKNVSGDLADPAGWSGGALPGESDYATIDKDGPYTSTADMRWGYFYYYAYGTTFDFTETPSRVMTICHSSDNLLINFMNSQYQTLTLKGGTWQFDSKRDMDVFYGKNTTKLILTNYCAIANAKILVINQQNGTTYSHDNEIVVADGSGVTATWARLGYGAAYNNKLTLLSGGTFNVGGWFWLDNNASAYGNTITVDGVGSKINLTGGDDFRMGNQGHNNTLLVRNGGAVEATLSTVLTIGAADGAYENVARFESAASLSVKGLNLKGYRNALSADFATISAGPIAFNGHGDSFVATNTPVTCSALSLASAAAHTGNKFVLNGSSTVMTFPVSTAAAGTDIFGSLGYGNLFALENGALWSPAGNLRIMQSSSNNVFRVASGATLSNPDYELTFGYANPSSCTGNRLEVLGGTVIAKKIFVQGVENGIVISNGTLRTSDIWSVCLGYKYGTTAEYDTTNSYLLVQGVTPRVDLPGGNFRVNNGACLRFEIPEGGYAAGHVPVTAGYFSFSEGSRIEIDCAKFAEKTGGKVKLLTVTNEMYPPDGDLQKIAEACTGLPPNCSLIVKPKEIWLKTPSLKGLALVVR